MNSGDSCPLLGRLTPFGLIEATHNPRNGGPQG